MSFSGWLPLEAENKPFETQAKQAELASATPSNLLEANLTVKDTRATAVPIRPPPECNACETIQRYNYDRPATPRPEVLPFASPEKILNIP